MSLGISNRYYGSRNGVDLKVVITTEIRIVLTYGKPAEVQILVSSTEDMEKVWDMKYHLDKILEIIEGKEEDEDEE